MRVFVISWLVIGAAFAFTARSFAQEKAPKVAIINIQQAIAQCNEGQDAAKALRDKFAPTQAKLEKDQREINDLQTQLKNQDKTLSDDARNKLLRSIDDKTRVFNRSQEDATAEFQQAEQDAINEIGRKMMAIINDHAQKNAYTIVLDISSPQTPVLYADRAIDITEEVIKLYNAAAPKPQSSAAPAAQPKPAAPAAAAPKPAAAPPPKPADPPKPAAAPPKPATP